MVLLFLVHSGDIVALFTFYLTLLRRSFSQDHSSRMMSLTREVESWERLTRESKTDGGELKRKILQPPSTPEVVSIVSLLSSAEEGIYSLDAGMFRGQGSVSWDRSTSFLLISSSLCGERKGLSFIPWLFTLS